MTPIQVPCSRSVHDENVLARRPQWDLHECHSQRDKRASLEGVLMRSVLVRYGSQGQPGHALCEWKQEGLSEGRVGRALAGFFQLF